MTEKKIGIIDLGSNSIRLVIFHIDQNGQYKELYNFKINARLATYIDAKGNLSNEGIEVVIDSLKKFVPIVQFHQVAETKGVATAAIRSAKNRKIVLEAIKRETNFDFRVLSGQEEAYYGYLAVIHSVYLTEGITIDIGGASTEVAYFKNRELVHSYSFPFGALTLKKRFIANSEPKESEMKELTAFLRNEFSSQKWLKNKNVPVIGIGGSARNLIRLHQNKTNYPLFGIHQYEMEPNEIKKINQWLIGMTVSERQKLDGLSKERADIIIPAIEAIYTLTEIVSAPFFTMSSKGLREGVFFEEVFSNLNVRSFSQVADETFSKLASDYKINLKNTSFLLRLAYVFVSECEAKKIISFTQEEKEILFKSTKLVQFGEIIDHHSSSQHTFYILTNRSLDGISHKMRLKLACVASFKSKKTLMKYISPYKSLLTEEEILSLERLGAILRFLYSLNTTHRSIISELEVNKKEGEKMEISLACNSDYTFEEQEANKQKKHMERAFNCQVELSFTLV